MASDTLHSQQPLILLVNSLNDQLKAAQHAYYVLAAPIITDAEYDTLEAQLRGVIDANPSLAELATALTEVGSDTVSDLAFGLSFVSIKTDSAGQEATPSKAVTGARIKHLRPMLSIENQYRKDDVVAWYLSLGAK